MASTLSSPLRLDKLAAFHDMVTSPEGRARLAAAAAAASPSPDSGAAATRKRPRLLLLDVPALVRAFPYIVKLAPPVVNSMMTAAHDCILGRRSQGRTVGCTEF